MGTWCSAPKDKGNDLSMQHELPEIAMKESKKKFKQQKREANQKVRQCEKKLKDEALKHQIGKNKYLEDKAKYHKDNQQLKEDCLRYLEDKAKYHKDNQQLKEDCLRHKIIVEGKDEDISTHKMKIKKLEEEKKTLLTRHQIIVEEKEADISKYVMEIQNLEGDKEYLLTRLSAMASKILTDGDANIADLSDENRPTKLAEKYSELYDNEWTDAYNLLIQHGETEENTRFILLYALCMAYKRCRDKAENDMKTMREAMKYFLGGQDPAPELIKPFKDRRKKNIKRHTKAFKKSLQSEVGTMLRLEETRTDPKMKRFLKNSIKLCWLMVIQDPPVFMDVNIKRSGDKYDNDSLHPYTKSEKYIDFMVWPTIYLQRDGNVLCKGVCQCKEDETIIQTVHDPQEAESEEQQTVPRRRKCFF